MPGQTKGGSKRRAICLIEIPVDAGANDRRFEEERQEAQFSPDLVMPGSPQNHHWFFWDPSRQQTREDMSSILSSSSGDGQSTPLSIQDLNIPDFTVASPFSDVMLISATHEERFGCKYNLSQRSPVLNRMFHSKMKESLPTQDMVSIPFPNMSTEALNFLLEYTFTGEILFHRYYQSPVEVIHVCRYFQLDKEPTELLQDIMYHLQLAYTDSLVTYGQISDRAAETLSKALEYLSMDEDKELFDYLLKVLSSRYLQSISPQRLTADALRFLLSRSLRTDAVEITPFATTEVATCLYLMLWAAQQLSGTALDEMQEFVNKVELAARMKTKLRAKLKPELSNQIAPIVLPFLSLIDLRLVRARDVALVIEPLKVIPQNMMFKALCYHAAHRGKSTQIFYRGPFVVQWDCNARSTRLHVCNTDDGRQLSCRGFAGGYARTVSPAREAGIYEWEVRIKRKRLWCQIGIGLCTDHGSSDAFSYAVWLGNQPYGWILDNNSRFWHNASCVPVNSNVTFTGHGREARVMVRLDMNARKCEFTYDKCIVVAPWTNIPDEVYPAVSFHKSEGSSRTWVEILPATGHGRRVD